MAIDPSQLADLFLPVVALYGARILGVLVILFVSARLAWWLKERTTAALEARRFDATIARFLGSAVRWTLLLAAVLACLSLFGIETTSFAAIIG
ncbi:MAG: hypothetical protein D6729_17795, partial [Deltaproteobacteria bacterium]